MSNLTVSYVSQTPAVTPAGVTAAAPATAADSPLGFLAALVDQLLAGGSEAIAGTTAEAGANVDVAGLLNATLGTKTAPAAPAPASDLLAALTVQLDKLQARAESGDAPPPAELPKLSAAIDALISTLDAKLAVPVAPTNTVPDPPAPIATPSETKPSATPSDQQITQLLGSLGLIAPQDAPAAPATPATPDVTARTQAQVDVAALQARLTALAQSVAATAPDLAQKLQALVTKLEPIAADPALAAQLGLTPPQPDPDALTIAHIIRSLLGHAAPVVDTDPTKVASNDATPASANPAPQVHDDLLQVLTSLGLNTPPVTTTATAGTTDGGAGATAPVVEATISVPQPLLRLSAQLSQVATELKTSAPDLASKLEAVATRLVSTEADANLLGKLTSAAAQSDEAALDTLVRNLIEARPAPAPAPTAPQIAAPSEMPIPAPIAPKPSKSAVTEVKAAPPEATPVTADSAPKPAPSVSLAAVSHETATDPAPEPKVEAKVAAVVADATKSDPAPQPAQPQPQQVANAQQARPLPAAYQPVANPINMGQVAFEMVRQVHLGTSRFTIRLDPPEMGRVDVKMHVDATGTVNARLTVDRAETLDLFQRDRQSLERALSQAGLDAGKTNLEFSLRQQHHNPFAGMMGGDQRQQQPGYGNAPRFSLGGNDDAASIPAVTLYRGTASAGGVNIFA